MSESWPVVTLREELAQSSGDVDAIMVHLENMSGSSRERKEVGDKKGRRETRVLQYLRGASFPTISDAMARSCLHGTWSMEWNSCMGFQFLPSRILDLCFCAMPTPPSLRLAQDETREYNAKLNTQATSILEADQCHEVWKNYPLYKGKKGEQERMCQSPKYVYHLSNKTPKCKVMQSL